MVTYKLYSWVDNGPRRIAVLKAMYKPMTPTQIYKNSKHYHQKISFNHTSDILRSFVKKELAVCINPEARRGRVYKLIEVGEEIRTLFMTDKSSTQITL